jgi:hypothetical protein
VKERRIIVASKRWLSVVLAAAVMAAGCSFIVNSQFMEPQPCDTGLMCSSGFVCVLNADGDGGLCLDGGVGGDDGGLPDASTCTARETQCGDGRDNDCDNTTDCADSDCTGVSCDDRDPCTTGEVCFGGSCPRGTAITCNTPPSPCQQTVGTCEAGTGRCLYGSLPDGTVCGSGQASRCCSGTCINTTLNGSHCGGCGLACSMAQVCQPIESSGCGNPTEPANTSGRCTCTGNSPCPAGQTCTNGVCYPGLATMCAGGQAIAAVNAADGGSCGFYCRY